MSRSRVPADVPAWPLWMAPAALAATWAAGWVVLVLVVVTLAIRGADTIDGAGAAAAVRPHRRRGRRDRMPVRRPGGAAGARAVRPASGPTAARRGRGARRGRLRRSRRGRRAARRGRVRRASRAPRGLQQGRFGRLIGDPDPTVVDLDLGAGCSVLARALILPLFTELLLRGFCLPILARRLGDGWAVAAVVALTAVLGAGAAGEGGCWSPASCSGSC